MRIELRVSVDVERESGKIAGRDELTESLIAEIESAYPGQLDGVGADGESTYTVESFEVEEIPQPKPGKPRATSIVFASARHAADLLYRMEGCTGTVTVKVGKMPAVVRGTFGGVKLQGADKGLTFLPTGEPGQRLIPFGQILGADINA